MRLVIAASVAVLLTCGAAAAAGDREKNPAPGGSSPPSPPPVPSAQTLLDDNFSDENWGTADDDNKTISYKGGELYFVVHQKNYFVWSTPDKETYDDIHMEATMSPHGADSTTAFGFMCNHEGTTNNFYYLAVTPAGQYAIARSANDKTDVFLTNDDKWAFSDDIAREADSYRVGADCGKDLVLYVDGKEIDRVSDSAYADGGVGIFVWSAEDATNTEVSVDDFVMTSTR
jgi:hypothetical protein